MHGPAIVGKQEFISRKMEKMQEAHIELQTIVGVREAGKLLSETLDTVADVKPQADKS
jgi:hypothetical protein